jgi:hypothetical protein
VLSTDRFFIKTNWLIMDTVEKVIESVMGVGLLLLIGGMSHVLLPPGMEQIVMVPVEWGTIMLEYVERELLANPHAAWLGAIGLTISVVSYILLRIVRGSEPSFTSNQGNQNRIIPE